MEFVHFLELLIILCKCYENCTLLEIIHHFIELFVMIFLVSFIK